MTGTGHQNRMSADNIAANGRLTATLGELAAAEECSPAQLAIAWLLARAPFVVPLPGTKQRKWLEENVKALDLTLSPETLAKLDATFAPGSTAGLRYPAGQMASVNV